MNKSIYYFMVLMFMSLSFDLVAQTSVDIPASKDNTLYESTSGAQSNGMGDHFFAGTTNQNENNIRRGLIAFDIAANVPAGATIESVVLKLNMSKTNALAVEQNIALHTVLQNWGEGASEASGEEGSGASAATDDATWTYTFYDTASWNTPGGDYDTEASATLDVDKAGVYSWTSEQMVADVQAWLDEPDNNFGWILIGGELEDQTVKRFDSREIDTEQNRPVLTVTFTENTTSVASSLRPTNFSLDQSYPNPVDAGRLRQSGATLSFSLAHPTVVSLAVYNILGQSVIRLKSGEPMATGGYAVIWNGRDASGQLVPPGMYLYSLKTPDGAQTKRILISK